MMTNSILSRDEVPVGLTWDLTSIFESDEAWDLEYKELEQLGMKMINFQDKVTQSAQSLFEVLEFDQELDRRINVLYLYAHLKLDQDTTNSTYQEMDIRVKTLFIKLAEATSIIIPKILEAEETVIDEYLANHEDLKLYDHYLKEINLKRPHILSTEQELVLTQMENLSSLASEAFATLNNADIRFPKVKNDEGEEVQLTHSLYNALSESYNRDVRKEAFRGIYQTYDQYKNTFAVTLAGHVRANNTKAQIRQYESSRHEAMSKNFIPEKVYDQLITTIHSQLPLLHRFTALRKKVLSVEELHIYDFSVPLTQNIEMKIPYEKAKQILIDSFAPLGKEYQDIVQRGFEERWIDVVENQGKKSGAYSFGAFGTNPYILMNWQDNLESLYTLSHEFGHSMHSYYTRNTQPHPYTRPSIFVAEVASTLNEELLFEHLLKTVEDPEQKIYLLSSWLHNFCNMVFISTLYAEFEHTIYEWNRLGEAITANKLTELYSNLMKQYYGDEMIVDAEAGLNWARIPHLYYNYYVYQYATGKSAATALSKQILEEGTSSADRYINAFLKAGSSNFPIEVLIAVGVDMKSPKPIIDACTFFEEKLKILEDLLTDSGLL
ncbi:oligoendopeptidase F [Solibacillus sp. CAU 1738]|uniref:oligoendopeptidase F n=1 Tax=Solibacillus sp. CAU 1738 TaxID=3140363 RepID=UPI0032618178